jgi:hypothetical protein
MFSYYLHDRPSGFRFKLVGALTGAAAAELEQCWLTALSTMEGRGFVVDLDGLTELDEAGRDLLLRWRSDGAQFLAKSKRVRSLANFILGDSLPIEPMLERTPPFRAFRFALTSSLVSLILLLPITVLAAGDPVVIPSASMTQSIDSPSSVLDRYNATLENRSDRTESGPVTLDIEASAPKLAKRARLQAIRRLVPFSKPEYEVVQIAGDAMVRRQVIARYLSADAEGRAMRESAVAISRANYKFRFVGSLGTGPSLAYVFQITPRKKRRGLIRGELWIDAATGIAVHQAGYLVKRPSLFLRRVGVVQDVDLREGRPYLRITRLDLDTLLAGRVELIAREHPCEPAPERDVETGAGPVTADATLPGQVGE